MKREELEKEAMKVCSPDIYYDLTDALDGTSDEDLRYIISCKGDYEKEILPPEERGEE